MSEQNPYTKLDVPEDASFEEIQQARDRLVACHPNDEPSRQAIEAAYDAILMDRLRKRQEGKITVPEGVRYAEQMAEKAAKPPLVKTVEPPVWLQQTLDQPDPKEVLISAGVFTALGTFAVFSQFSQQGNPEDSLAFLLALGVGFTMYWLNRKEQRLGRAFLLTLGTLVLGGILSTVLLQFGLPVLGISHSTLATLIILALFWLVSSFLR